MRVVFLLVIAATELVWSTSVQGTQPTSSELQRLSGKVDDLGDHLGDEIESVRDEIRNVGNDIENLGDEIEAVGNDIENAGDEIENVEGELGDVEDKLYDLKAEVQSLRSDVDTIKSQQNTTLHLLQEIKEKISTTSQQLTDSVVGGSQECAAKVAREFEVANERMEQHQINNDEQFKNISNELHSLVLQPGDVHDDAHFMFSCPVIAKLGGSSGYYQLIQNPTKPSVSVYCDMERQCCGSTGGWMRIAYINMTDPDQQCPKGFRLRTTPKRVCERLGGGGCTSIMFSNHAIQYSKVCGQVRAYQSKATQAYNYHAAWHHGVNGGYLDGVSITHGGDGRHHGRRHVWSFVAAMDEVHSGEVVCPCTNTSGYYTGGHYFMGTDYFCDTGSREQVQDRFYHEDPLWDGEGCGPDSSCCQFNSPPWFCKELPHPTTDDIEVRVCRHYDYHRQDTPIELIELYVQ